MSDPDTPSSRLADIARPQHGLFTIRQAADAGFATTTINARVVAGQWQRLGRGVLGFSGVPVTFRRAAMAATMSIDGAVASHETAATLHGFRYLESRPIAISVPPASWQQLPGVHVHRYQDLADRWITTVHGIPATNPERTMIDLAAVLRPARLELVLDAALAQNVDIGRLIFAFNRLARRGRRGIGRLRPLLDARGDGYVAPDSELEKRFLQLVRRNQLPEPVRQMPTWWEARLIGLADFAFPVAKVIVEVDGRLGHTQLLDREGDLLRDQLAGAAGWRVLRITYRQLTQHADRTLDLVRSAVRAAA
jgi:very-short-patch-repair endonuclease